MVSNKKECERAENLLENIKKLAKSDFDNKIIFKKENSEIISHIEKIYELTKDVHMTSMCWITISLLRDSCRIFTEVKALYQKIMDKSSFNFSSIIQIIDEYIDLCIIQLHFYCGELGTKSSSYWIECVEEFKEQQFFIKHRQKFIPFTLKSYEEKEYEKFRGELIHKLANFMADHPTIFTI